nr:hypothetical protein [Tanacetum cinerariifolium]
ARVQSKEHCDSLIAQINAKSVENSDLNAQLQDNVFTITGLKEELRKLKGKCVVDYAVSKSNAITIAPIMLKIDVQPIAPKLLNNRTAHSDYLKHTQEQAAILRERRCSVEKNHINHTALVDFTMHVLVQSHHDKIMDVDILNGRMRSLLEMQVLFRDLQHFQHLQFLLCVALSHGNVECSNYKLLTMKIKILEARIAMERHPDDHACQSAAILHEL